MASPCERFITSHVGTTKHFYGSRMGGWWTESPGRAFYQEHFASEILWAYFGMGGAGRGSGALEWSTSFKMAENLMFVCYLQFEFVKQGISLLHLKL